MFSFDGLLDVQTKYSNRSRGHKTNNRKEYVKKREKNKRAMIYWNSTKIYDTHENDFAIFDVGREKL